jgi:hypothetical protein
MKTNLSALAFSVLLTTICLLPTASSAQGWAVEVGPSYNIQKGTFIAPCSCTFADGTGLGLIGAVSYDVVSFGGVHIGLSTGVDLQKFTAKEVFPASLQQVLNGDQEEVKLAYITLDPYLRYKIPGTGLFFQVSPGVDYLVSSNFSHIASADSAGQTKIDLSSAFDVRKASYHAKLSAGYSIGFLGIALEPAIYVKEPLTDLSVAGASGWHVTTLYASLAIRFGM